MLEEIFKKLNGKSFDEYISSLNGEELRNFLIFINAKVRNIEMKDGGLVQDEGRYLDDGTYKEYRMNVGGELIAPRKDIQNRSFEKISSMLNKVNNKQHKAIVMYSLINYLHLFEDGNGRTSRVLYDLITGNISESKQDVKYYTHKEGENLGPRGQWRKERKVQHPRAISSIASQFLMKYLLNEKIISSPSEDLSNHIQINTIQTGFPAGIYISEDNKSQLSRKTLEHIRLALSDRNESIATSALSILAILTHKGNVKPLKSYYFNREWKVEGDLVRNAINIGSSRDEETFEIFGEYPEDSSKKTFEGWTPEDYLKLVDVTDKIKECTIDLIIDFAERPESFKYDKTGKNLMDVLVGEELLPERFGVEMYHAPFKVDKESRVYKSIGQIREILDTPRTCDEEKYLIDTYEKGKIKASDLSKAKRILEGTLNQNKQNHIESRKGE